jgi:phosphohistidine phosphatase
MNRLYLLRHGLADRNAWDGPDDERPLTPAGKERMTRSAETMAHLDLGVDLILTSPLTRAYQTAEIVADRLGLRDRLHREIKLALGFGPAALAKILRDRVDAERIMLVGHEPDFSLTVGAITGGCYVVCKKGSLVRIDLIGTAPPAGELVWLIPPKVLAGQ